VKNDKVEIKIKISSGLWFIGFLNREELFCSGLFMLSNFCLQDYFSAMHQTSLVQVTVRTPTHIVTYILITSIWEHALFSLVPHTFVLIDTVYIDLTG
jgi:hypothetical protein